MKFWKIPYWQLLVLPLLCYSLGFTSNKVVKAFNHNQMPVLWYGDCTKDINEEILAPTHQCMTKSTHLNFLADWIDIKVGFESLGDVLLDLFDMTFSPFLFTWVILMVKDSQKGSGGAAQKGVS